MRLYILIISCLLQAYCFATGADRGNGGDGVVCRNTSGSIISTELLDFFEARELRGIEVGLGGNSLGFEEKIYLALERLSKLDKPRAIRYQKRFETFFEDVHWTTAKLVDIPDYGEFLFDPECGVEQVAIRRKPVFPHDKAFVINKPLWQAMDKNSKAGLVLHEIIYENAVIQGYNDSRVARYFNSIVCSEEIEAFVPETYQKFMRDLIMADDTWFSRDGELHRDWIVFFPKIKVGNSRTARKICDQYSMSLYSGLGTEYVDGGMLKAPITEGVADEGFIYGSGFFKLSNPGFGYKIIAGDPDRYFLCRKAMKD